MTTSEQSDREEADETESTVHVDRLAVSVTDGTADAKTAKVTRARRLRAESLSISGTRSKAERGVNLGLRGLYLRSRLHYLYSTHPPACHQGYSMRCKNPLHTPVRTKGHRVMASSQSTSELASAAASG